MKKSLFSFSAITRKSIADVTRRRGRTLLVILGIMIGVLGLTAVNVGGDAIQTSFAYTMNHTQSPNISIQVQAVNPALATELAAVSNVQDMQIDTVYSTRWHVAAAPGHVNMVIVGYQNFSAVKLNPFQLVSGRLPGSGEVVMETSDRTLQSVAIGDMVSVDTPHGLAQLRVVGISRTLGQNSSAITGTATAYMSGAALSQITGVTTANDIEVKVFDKNAANQTITALLNVLHANHVTVFSAAVIPDTNISTLTGLLTILGVLSFIALVLTSFLIINTVTTLVAEQTKIIGTMKALGGSRRAIIGGYLLSIAIYGIAGTILGLALGIACGYLFASFIATLSNIDLIKFSVSPTVFLISVLVGLGVPFAAALLPLWMGTRVSVREAMAEYGMSNQRGRASRHVVGQHMTWVPQTTWLGLRGIFRKRGRAILTLLALTLSGTAFLAIQTTTYSFDQLLGTVFNTYNFDVQVSTGSPQPYALVRTKMMAVPNVGRIERIGQQLVSTHWGQLELEGLEADTQEYRHQLVAGRWFNGNEPNALLISNDVASKTGLKVGDTVTFSSATKTVTWTIIGEVHDDNGVGVLGVGLTTIDNMNNFNGLPAGLAQTFLVQGVDRSQKAVDRMANQLDDVLSQAGLAPTVSTSQQFIARNQSVFSIFSLLFYAVAAIVALVGILGLFNTLTTSVLERRREIGIMRSMGATGWRVASVFWLEGISLAVIAWFVGTVLGIPGAYAFVSLLQAVFLPIPFAFDPTTLAVMLVFILAIATLASIGPVLSATRMRIVDTLRYE